MRERKKGEGTREIFEIFDGYVFSFPYLFYHDLVYVHIQLQLELYDQVVVEYLYRPFFNSLSDKSIDALLALDDLTLNPFVVLCSNLVGPYRVRRVVLLAAMPMMNDGGGGRPAEVTAN